jgi:hypothetical protein
MHSTMPPGLQVAGTLLVATGLVAAVLCALLASRRALGIAILSVLHLAFPACAFL